MYMCIMEIMRLLLELTGNLLAGALPKKTIKNGGRVAGIP